MNPVLAMTIFVFGSLAGFIGWRRATKPIYRRSMFGPDPPVGVSRRDFERALRRRRKIWRVVITIFYALFGALLGVLFLALLNRH